MKKLTIVLLIFALTISFVSCNKSDYPPVESTEKEATVLMTFDFEGDKYELKYELYRALFLNYSKLYDNGDASFWSKPESIEAKEDINETVISLALDIFSALHLCKKIGYDPYSNDADNTIDEYIRTEIEGDGMNDGFGGDYDAYLASLKEMNLNYSTQVLLFRYGIAYDKILEYYAGNENPDETLNITLGKLEYTKEDVEAFYRSDNCARISATIINARHISKARANEIRNHMAYECSTTEEVLNYAVGNTAGDPTSILDGVILGKNSMDYAYYETITDSAFDLGVNETSEVIEVSTGNGYEYWILYKLEKTDKYLNDHYADVENAYVSERIGEIIDNVKNSLEKSCKFSDDFELLDYSGLYEK